jgi:hypothetical protein
MSNKRKLTEELELSFGQMREMHQGLTLVLSLDFPTSISFDIAIIRQLIKPFIDAWDESHKKLFEKFSESVKDPKTGKTRNLVPEDSAIDFSREESILNERRVKVELPLIYLQDLEDWKNEVDDDGNKDRSRQIPSGFIISMYPVIRR